LPPWSLSQIYQKKKNVKEENKMNIYDLLKTDHDKVKGILEEMLTNKQAKEKQQNLLLNLSTELFKHNQAEEETFYKLLEQYPETKDIIAHSEEEHEKVERYLVDLESMEPNGGDWGKIMEAMREAILNHIEQEENEVFPKSQDLLPKEQLTNLGENFKNVKKEIEKNELQI
jgi:hypothetical protein